jgi:hypothetical protein
MWPALLFLSHVHRRVLKLLLYPFPHTLHPLISSPLSYCFLNSFFPHNFLLSKSILPLLNLPLLHPSLVITQLPSGFLLIRLPTLGVWLESYREPTHFIKEWQKWKIVPVKVWSTAGPDWLCTWLPKLHSYLPVMSIISFGQERYIQDQGWVWDSQMWHKYQGLSGYIDLSFTVLYKPSVSYDCEPSSVKITQIMNNLSTILLVL